MNTTTNAAAQKSAIAATIGLDGQMGPNGVLQLDFSNGKMLNVQLGDLSSAILEQACLHGLKQKLVDAAAISRNTETGRAASVEDKYDAVKEVLDRLLSGSWNKPREGGTAVSGGLLLRALCRMYAGKKNEEAVRAFLAEKTDAEKAALRKNAKVAAVIAELRAEAGKGDSNESDDMLAELGE